MRTAHPCAGRVSAKLVVVRTFENQYLLATFVLMTLVRRIRRPANQCDSLAIKFMQQNILRPSQGDRPDVPNLVMVLTDGQSYDYVESVAAALRVQVSDFMN